MGDDPSFCLVTFYAAKETTVHMGAMTMPTDVNNYYPYLALKNTSGVGAILFKRLMDEFGSPDRVFRASEKELLKIDGLSQFAAERIQAFNGCTRSEHELEMIKRFGLNITAMTDPDYPTLLKEIPDPPPLLTYLGTLENQAPCIAIVGSRKPTSYGLDTAFRLGRELAASGFQVVSGMARGIDTASHTGALAAGGRSLAVVGCGLATVYPPENRQLFNDLQDHGAVLSEFSVTAAPEPRNFPIRNRIIAGLSTGTVIVEAAARSGSLITARLTAEYGRDVFAVPGSIRSSKSQGTHSLLKQGATLVENTADIIEQLHHLVHAEPLSTNTQEIERDASKPGQDMSEPFKAVLNLLSPYPVHIDDIINRSGLDPGVVCAALLDLELQGIVQQTPGKHFAIIEELP